MKSPFVLLIAYVSSGFKYTKYSEFTLTSGRVALGVFRALSRLSPPKVGLLPLLFPRVVDSMNGLSRRGFSISGAGASGIGSVGRVGVAAVVGEWGESVFESKRGEESFATSSSGVSAEMPMSSPLICEVI